MRFVVRQCLCQVGAGESHEVSVAEWALITGALEFSQGIQRQRDSRTYPLQRRREAVLLSWPPRLVATSCAWPALSGYDLRHTSQAHAPES